MKTGRKAGVCVCVYAYVLTYVLNITCLVMFNTHVKEINTCFIRNTFEKVFPMTSGVLV